MLPPWRDKSGAACFMPRNTPRTSTAKVVSNSSTGVSAIRAFVDWAISGVVGVLVFTLVLAVVFASLAWAALYAAGVARRRIRLSTEQPIKALFETIGACGDPPKDDSYTFAVYAIVLLVLAWILIPAAAWLVISKT